MVDDRLSGLALLHIHRQGQSARQKWGSALVNYLADIYGIMYRHKHFKYGFKVWWVYVSLLISVTFEV